MRKVEEYKQNTKHCRALASLVTRPEAKITLEEIAKVWEKVAALRERVAFEPEVIETMSAAFVAACDALQLKVGDDPATRVVAEKVINLAQRGIRDPIMLRAMTLKEFDLSDESGPL